MAQTHTQQDFEGVFSHERLDVYRIALRFTRWAWPASQRLPVGRSAVRDQLMRASEGVVLNIAEGAQQVSPQMARKHYRIALASAAECAAGLDLLEVYRVQGVDEGRQLVNRIGAMLRKMVR
ncbi:four helix bundle protein [bacterium]|nr:four helix bundle protein [bacterium]